MTKKCLNIKYNKYFIICIVEALDDKKLKRTYKRFISSNYNDLKRLDIQHKMFYKNGKFKELKGSSLNKDMKIKFINYFCQNNLINIYYIVSNNVMVQDIFYSNSARSFNYLIKLCFEHNSKNNNIHKSINFLFIDERNIRTESIATLCDYLNTELVLANNLQNGFFVSYCQSEVRKLIQIADVFSNIYFSYLHSGNVYDKEIEKMRKLNYIKNEFNFPIIFE